LSPNWKVEITKKGHGNKRTHQLKKDTQQKKIRKVCNQNKKNYSRQITNNKYPKEWKS